jgi:cold shock CspA family protein
MSTATATATPAVTPSSEKFTGRVKWFNNKAGYGFITVTDGSKTGSDIFVHHSSIKVDAQQYKYLVQGEYTEFSLSSVSASTHEFQAADVSGIKGGKLMCETRYDAKSTRTTYKDQEQEPEQKQVSSDATASAWKTARRPRQQAAPTAAPVAEVKRSTSGRGPTSTGGGRGQGQGRGRGTTAGRGGRG